MSKGSICRKNDPAWKYAVKFASPNDGDGNRYLYCKFCNQKCTGGITRLKHHLAGTSKGMKPCKKTSDEAKLECQKALQTYQQQKAKQNEVLEEIGAGFGASFEDYEDGVSLEQLESRNLQLHSSSGSGHGSLKSKTKTKGPMDKFTTSEARQTTLNSKWKQEERRDVCRKLGRFVFSAGLSFNVVNDPYWKPALEAVGRYGIGLNPPSMHEMRTWVLKAEVDDVNKYLEEHKKAWNEFGCSIMSDGWTDGKSRCLLNFLVNSPAGTWFLKSVDASDTIKNGELMFNYLDEVIDEVGEENVVQVIHEFAGNRVPDHHGSLIPHCLGKRLK